MEWTDMEKVTTRSTALTHVLSAHSLALAVPATRKAIARRTVHRSLQVSARTVVAKVRCHSLASLPDVSDSDIQYRSQDS